MLVIPKPKKRRLKINENSIDWAAIPPLFLEVKTLLTIVNANQKKRKKAEIVKKNKKRVDKF